MIIETKLADLEEYSADRFVVKPVFEGAKSKAKLLHLDCGQEVPVHPHQGSEIVLIPQKGEATLIGDDKHEQQLSVGTVYYQGLQPTFGIKNVGTTPFQTLVLLIQIPGD